MAQTSEKAFEIYLEQMLAEGGWHPGTNAEWDKARALFPARVFAFIEATQPKLWAEMAAQHGNNLQAMLLDALGKGLDIKGSLHVLRHGFKFYGKLFRLAYFKPAHALSPDVLALYAQNQLTVTRQVPCHPGDHSTVDMVLAVNGLPVATIELKNPGTHQTWRHAVTQYQSDRDPRVPLFDFKKRALVHFAADPDEVWMTTRLAKEKTFFLPFNRGNHPGQIQWAQATRSTPAATVPATSGRKRCSATAFSTSSGTSCSSKKTSRRWTMAGAARGWSPPKKWSSRATTSWTRCAP